MSLEMIQKRDVKHVAKLARLNLTEDEVESFTQQLGNILDYIHNLEKIDTEQIEPTAHVLTIRNVFRDDELKKSLDLETVFNNASKKEGGYFKTPKIMES